MSFKPLFLSEGMHSSFLAALCGAFFHHSLNVSDISKYFN